MKALVSAILHRAYDRNTKPELTQGGRTGANGGEWRNVKGFFSCKCSNMDSETEAGHCSSAASANAHVLSHRMAFYF